MEEENKGKEGLSTRNQQAKDFPRDRQGRDFRYARETNESSREKPQVQQSTSLYERGEAQAGGGGTRKWQNKIIFCTVHEILTLKTHQLHFTLFK